MAFTLNGFGTKFYGEADVRPDGSFVTTEWITALYVPLIPLRSFRFVRVRGGVNVVVFHSQSYAILEKLPVCWPQVGRVYAFVFCTALWWSLGGFCLGKFKVLDGPNATYWVIPFIAMMALPFGVAWWLRRKASRAAQQQQSAASEPPPLR